MAALSCTMQIKKDKGKKTVYNKVNVLEAEYP